MSIQNLKSGLATENITLAQQIYLTDSPDARQGRHYPGKEWV